MQKVYLFGIFFLGVVSSGSVQSSILTKSSVRTIALGKNFSETLLIPKLVRVAVGNSKILRVKVISPSSLLLTGVSLGKTSLRVWSQGNNESLYWVSVAPPESIVSAGSRGQVAHVSLEFLELDESVGRNSGIQWPETVSFAGLGSMQGNQSGTGLNYSASFSTAQGFLHFLVKEGWAKLLTSPDLYVRLGEQAVFHSGGEFPVSTGADAFGRYQRKVDWKKFGLTAKVKPDSPDEEHFQTDIQLEISELDHSYQVENIPSLTVRNFSTKIDSIEGETVILSGLIRQARQSETQKVPLLGDLPILGKMLFSKNSTGTKATELLMAVTIEMTTRVSEKIFLGEFKERFHQNHD